MTGAARYPFIAKIEGGYYGGMYAGFEGIRVQVTRDPEMAVRLSAVGMNLLKHILPKAERVRHYDRSIRARM